MTALDFRFADAALAAHKHDRGWVELVEEQLTYDPTEPNSVPLRRPQTARAVEAVLAANAGVVLPGVLLDDGSVLVLSWSQADALAAAFDSWRRSILLRTDSAQAAVATIDLE